MKKFFLIFFAVLAGGLICLLVSILILSALFSTPTAPTLPAKAVLHIDMSKFQLAEQSLEDPIGTLSGEEEGVKLGILDIDFALQAAAVDPHIKFVYLKPDATQAGIGHIEELRVALERFKNSCDKSVVAWMESPGNAAYYLGSVADELYLSSAKGASPTVTGLSSQQYFLKDVLDRLGVNVQLIRHGKYKSAGEMFVRSDISEANRQQYEALLGSVWNSCVDQICKSRGIEAERFNKLLNELKLCRAEDFLREGLVDALLSKEEMDEKLCIRYGCSKRSDIQAISLADYIKLRTPSEGSGKDKIAVIFADGEMVTRANPRSRAPEIEGTAFANMISDIREDESIKAVVLRVNSPGGAVLAADKVKAEIDRLKAVKPVIASFGNYAASGGYWISAGCQRIFTDNTTLTGSIGVFSMIPDLSKTVRKLHLGSATIKTNAHSDMYSLMRPLDAAELSALQQDVEDIYDSFTGLVAEGRKLDKAYVDEIAQGRVWSGTESLGKGLTDEKGTLEDALRYAASVANGDNGSDLSLWQVVSYPAVPNTFEQLMSLLGNQPQQEEIFSGTPLQDAFLSFRQLKDSDFGKVYARMSSEFVIQ